MENHGPLSTLLDRQKPAIRWGLVIAFVVSTALIMPKFFRASFSWEPGRAWQGQDLVSEFDFALYKTEAQLAADRKLALAAVAPVYIQVPGARQKAQQHLQDLLRSFTTAIESFAVSTVAGAEEEQEQKRREIINQFGLDPEELLKGVPSWEEWKRDFPSRLSQVLGRLYDRSLADTVDAETGSDRILLRTAANEGRMMDRAEILSLREAGEMAVNEWREEPEPVKRLAHFVINNSLKPNVQYDALLTTKEKDRALSKVSTQYGKVKAGEVIVARGQIVTAEVEEMLQSYLRASQQKFGRAPYWLTFVGQLALMSMITFMLVLYLRTNRPRIFYRNRKLALVLLLYFMAAGLLVLALKVKMGTWQEYKLNYAFLAPVCMVPIVLTTFFDPRFGFFGNIIISLIGGSIVPNGFEYFFVQMVGGTVSVYSLGRLRNRSGFFVSLAYILTAYAGAFIGYSFYVSSGFQTIHYGNLLLLLINVGATLSAWLVIYVFEKGFGLTSDLTFMELLDTNHPLLKELMLKAPGTFQHSLQVANIAEAIMNRIGGNSLKAKVGALFHDVGKMKNPHFFRENIQDDQNPHEGLSDEESSKIIIQHVVDGVKLAREHNLPAEVIDFIKTHHGTSRTEFFYRHYKSEHPGEEIPDEKFRYPGPIPFTREMAVVMIADTIEAAARALKDHTPAKLKELIDSLVESKMKQNQFINCNITFRDLEDVKQVTFLQLVTIYHDRIEYPAEPTTATDEG